MSFRRQDTALSANRRDPDVGSASGLYTSERAPAPGAEHRDPNVAGREAYDYSTYDDQWEDYDYPYEEGQSE